MVTFRGIEHPNRKLHFRYWEWNHVKHKHLACAGARTYHHRLRHKVLVPWRRIHKSRRSARRFVVRSSYSIDDYKYIYIRIYNWDGDTHNKDAHMWQSQRHCFTPSMESHCLLPEVLDSFIPEKDQDWSLINEEIVIPIEKHVMYSMVI